PTSSTYPLSLHDALPILTPTATKYRTPGMAAARATVEYGTPSVSAMMNAAAPMTGGMSWPPMDAVASTPAECRPVAGPHHQRDRDRKSTRLNSCHVSISY